jgi:hypothetical protein
LDGFFYFRTEEGLSASRGISIGSSSALSGGEREKCQIGHPLDEAPCHLATLEY